jgi:hypothetical protein
MNRLLIAMYLLMAAAPAHSLAQVQPPRMRLTEDLRLDANTEDFPVIGAIHIGPRREIVVPVRQDLNLRIYDSTGKRIAVVGRRGDGPGEFQAIGQMGWVADTLWAYDFQHRRITFISPSGTVLRSTLLMASLQPPRGNVETAGALEWFVPYALFADGAVVGEGRFHQPRVAGKYVWAERRIVHAPVAGGMRTLAKSPEYENGPWFMTVEVFGRSVPYAPLPQTVFSPDGRRFAFLTTDIQSRAGGTYTIQMFGTTGEVIFNKTFSFAGTVIPQRVVDSTLAAMIPPAGRGTEGPADMPQRFQALAKERIPPVYAPVQSIILGLDNTTWVVLRRNTDGQTAIALNARGEPVGSLSVPTRSRIWQGSASHVWMTETDSDGLVSVVRYRLSGIGCAPPECR